MFDYLIVGAGFAGSVLAERLATICDKRILICDKRPHIGGNAYDHYNNSGILVHKYGPHIFHTNSKDIFDYLSKFTEWRQYEHRVLASIDGMMVPLPINLDTVNRLYNLNLSVSDMQGYLDRVAIPLKVIRTSEDVVINAVGRDLYDKVFRNYTRKQWGVDPSELDASVAARLPVRLSRDSRYFSDSYQAMPANGYTRLFEKMLNHPNITVALNIDYRQLMNEVHYGRTIFTGPVDEFFNWRLGKLPYRSLHFRHETYDKPIFQSSAVINYPNDQPYTRVTEFKYLTGQEHSKTSVVYEYPSAEGDPYYPVPKLENQELYKKYKQLADATPGVYFVGRLGTYKYYNMDQVTGQALAVFSKFERLHREETRSRLTSFALPSPDISVMRDRAPAVAEPLAGSDGKVA